MTGAVARRARLILTGLLMGVVGALSIGAPVFADPAGPTDYRSEVVAVEPPTASIDVRIVGGDSFVELTAEPGTDVVVIGYQGEQYLWIRPDGTVLENLNSPSTYTNRDRFGGGDIPPDATADAEPDWDQVGSGGRWAWHDHRAHWMQNIRPPGLGAGDQILEAVIPLAVDGTDVDVTVISVWQDAPSPVPIAVGFGTGLVAAGAAWWFRSRRWAPSISLPIAGAALLIGGWQFISLPPETGPRPVWWVLPALAVVAAGVASVAGWRRSRFVAWSAVLVTGVELAIWAWIRREGLGRAIIPTDAPDDLDRLVTAMALAGGVGLAIVAGVELFARRVSDSREQTDSPLRAHP